MNRIGAWSEPFEAHGTWWRIDAPDRRVGGKLIYTPGDGLRLEVRGAPGLMDIFESLEPLVLNGTADNGEWTLVDCQLMTGSPSAQDLRVGYAFDGVAINTEQLASLDTIIVEFDAMWSVIDARPRDTSEGSAPPPIHLAAELHDGSTLELRSSLVELSREDWNGIIQHQDRLHFIGQTPTPVAYDELFRRFVDPLQHLMTLAFQSDATVRSCQMSGPDVTTGKGGGAELRRRPTVVRDQISSHRPPVAPAAALFIPTDPARFQTIISNWFVARSTLQTPVTLRLLELVDGMSYSEPRFLLAAQALEALHRRIHPDSQNAEDVKARTVAIAAAPDDLKQWLTTRLSHAHEPTYRKRIRSLMQDAAPQFDEVIGPRSMRRVIEGHLVDARNEVTHWDPSTDNADGLRLAALRLVANALFDLALLKYVGLNDDELAAAVRAHRRNNVDYWLARALAE